MRGIIVNHLVFRLVIPFFYGALLYLVLLLINNNLSALDENFFSQEMSFCIIICYLVFEGIRAINYFIFRSGNKPFQTMIMVLFVGPIIAIALSWFGLWVYFKFVLGYQYIGGFSTEFKVFALLYGVSGLLYNLLYISHYLLMKRNDQLLNQEMTLKEILESELNAYQTDINPSLFFESLESAITLLETNPDDAEYFLDQLALVYRHILTGKNTETLPLEKELDVCGYYLHLVNVRYRNLVNLTTSQLPIDCRVIPGAILGLVEQIVNESIISEAKPLNIKLYKEDDYLIISYNENQCLRIPDRRKHFDNLQKTYAILTEKPVLKVQAYGECFYKLPMTMSNQAVAS